MAKQQHEGILQASMDAAEMELETVHDMAPANTRVQNLLGEVEKNVNSWFNKM